MKRYYCTYFDRNYLCKALAMIESLVRSEPASVHVYAICMDEITRLYMHKLNLPIITPIPMHAIEVGDAALLQTKRERTLVEYYWTTTPTIILRLLERYPEIDTLTYLDADLFFFSSPQPIFDELATGSVLIHEHRYSPDLAYLEKNNGRFNVGLLSFKNNEQGLKVLRWWRDRCIEWCFWRNEDGKMGDQMYLNDWPERFKEVVVLQNQGAGVAPWNYNRYAFTEEKSGKIRVDGQPLIFYHFHSFNYMGKEGFVPHHMHYGFNHDALRLCFLVYQEVLHAFYAQIKRIDKSFSFGIGTIDENTNGTIVAIGQDRTGDGQPLKDIDDQWQLMAFKPQHQLKTVQQRQKSENVTPILPEELLWPHGKPVSSPDDLLFALKGRIICDDIRVLYVIGAFKFEEEPLFYHLFPFLEKIVLIEPISQLAASLVQRYAQKDNIVVLPYAISDVDERSSFFLTNNFQSSSLLAMGHHLDVFPEVQKTQTIEVECKRVDTIIEQHKLPSPDMLFIDAQGAELRILSAIPHHLRCSIKLLYTEASTKELYVDSGTLTDIQKELEKEFAFAGYAPTRNEIPIHGNALFVNRSVKDRIAFKSLAVQQDTPAGSAGEHASAAHIQQALSDANRQFKDAPEDPNAMVRLAGVLEQIGKTKEAAVFLRLALKVQSQHALARQSLAHVIERLINEGQNGTARDCCLTLLAAEPDEKFVQLQWERLMDEPDAKNVVEIERSAPKNYRVSAIVSTYKSENFIRECLENLQQQSIADQIEIVIVDAASPENERGIIAEYQQKYDNITYIRTNERIGVYPAWNIAIAHARAPYCISVSTNDQLRQDGCEVLADALDQEPETVLVFGDTYLTHYPHETFENNRHYATYQWPEYSFQRHLSEGCCVGPHPMWRRSVHQKVGYFDERFIADGDQEFWMRLGSRFKIRHIPEFTSLQWLTPESLSGKGDTPLLEVSYIQSKYRQWTAMQVLN